MNELIHQFESFSTIDTYSVESCYSILYFLTTIGKLKATRMISKTELVMPRTVAGFRLYNMMFAYSLCT